MITSCSEDISAMFVETVFYLDQDLPRHTVEGTRISQISQDTDFILTLDYSKFEQYEENLMRCQYVFDCQEIHAMLYSEFYKVNVQVPKTFLINFIAVVNKIVSDKFTEYTYKLKTLDASVRVRGYLDITQQELSHLQKNSQKQMPAEVLLLNVL